MDFMKVLDQTVREMYVRVCVFFPLVFRPGMFQSHSCFYLRKCRKREVNLKVLMVPEIEQKVMGNLLILLQLNVVD